MIIVPPKPTRWQLWLAFMLKHPYLIVVAGVLYFAAVFALEGDKGAVLAMLLGLTAVKVLLYAFAIYIIAIMFQWEQKKFSIYVWMSIVVASCSVIPYSGWVFQSLVLFWWQKDLRKAITFAAAAVIIDIAFALINPIFVSMVH